MGEAGNVVVAQGGDKDLRLVLETTKSFAVYDAVSISLKGGACGAGAFFLKSATGQGAFYRMGGEPR